jgi:CubicO group peptidase (beta-lactamase class C family)
MRIRPMLAAGLVAGVVITPYGAAQAISAATTPTNAGTAAAAVPGPPTVTPADLRFTPGRTLRYGAAPEVGLLPEHVTAITATARRFMEPSPTFPMYPGAVVLAARDGVIVKHEAMGHAVRYASYDPATRRGEELPREDWVPTRYDTIYDMASVTKLFTSIVVMQQVERGRIKVDAPVTDYIPEFAAEGKGNVTVRHLLTHTSGLPAWLPLYRDYPTPEERYQAVWAVKPQAAPDTRYVYSDLNLIALGKIVEKVSGMPLDQVVSTGITGPLRMTDTGFNPPESKHDRVAATEWMPALDRGMIRGTVHDENAWSFGGVAGHAGIFSTAGDLATLAQALLNGGRYGRVRLLSEDSVRSMLTNYNTAFPDNSHGLGFELNQFWYMGAISSPVTAGHTGFTGTSMVIDPLSRSFIILMANRVHPTRDWGTNTPSRRAVAQDLGRALPVRPAIGAEAWYAGMRAGETATLTLPVPAGAARLDFALWYDTEPRDDQGVLEGTVDGQTWQPVPMALRAGRFAWNSPGTVAGFAGRTWARARAALPSGLTALRWRYSTANGYTGLGRGVYVDGVMVRDAAGRPLVDGERNPGAFQPSGWSLSRD